MSVGDKAFTSEMVKAVETRVSKALGSNAYVERYIGAVSAVDQATNTVSVKLLGSDTGSAGFRVRGVVFPAVNDIVVACIAGEERWVDDTLRGATTDKFLMGMDGSMSWGPGSGAAFDTNLYRSAADTLATNDNILLTHPSGSRAVISEGGGGNPQIGVRWTGDTVTRTAMIPDGLRFGPGNGWDTNLYRSAADILKTDDALQVGTSTFTNIAGVICIPFSWTGTLAGSGTLDIPLFDSSVSSSTMRVPFSVSVVGLSVTLGSNRTAGTLVAQSLNASTSTLVGPSATIDGVITNLQQVSEATDGTVDLAGGQQLRMRITTTSFTPTANSVKVLLWLAVAANTSA